MIGTSIKMPDSPPRRAVVMKTKKKYTVIIEDDSRLEKIIQISASPGKYFLAGISACVCLMCLGAVFVGFSPVKKILPGYLKDSERTANEIQHMRLDSLQQIYETNASYINNIMSVINLSVAANDVHDNHEVSQIDIPFEPDSLLPTSPEERKFLAMMREREKYNISVIAPLAAESLMFSAVNEESVISENTKLSTKAEIILGKGATVAAIADGRVISVSQSVREGGGSAIVIQHAKGFLSRCNRLGTVLIEPGDLVSGGQVIALTASGNSRKNEVITIEMWHNGNQLVPNDYLGDKDTSSPRYPIIDEEVGRGRL